MSEYKIGQIMFLDATMCKSVRYNDGDPQHRFYSFGNKVSGTDVRTIFSGGYVQSNDESAELKISWRGNSNILEHLVAPLEENPDPAVIIGVDANHELKEHDDKIELYHPIHSEGSWHYGKFPKDAVIRVYDLTQEQSQ